MKIDWRSRCEEAENFANMTITDRERVLKHDATAAEAHVAALTAEIEALRAMCLQAADIFDANDFGHDLRFKLRDAALPAKGEG